MIGLIYVAMAAIYIVPGVLMWMWKMASRIRAATDFPGTQTLEAVLSAKRTFWRFCGIFTIVMIGLWIAGMVVAIGIGVMSAALV